MISMKGVGARERVIVLGLISYLVMATIGLMTTNATSRPFVELTRAATIALVLLISAGLTAMVRVNVIHLLAVLIYFLLLLVGFVMAEIHGVAPAYSGYAVDVLVILPGLFIFSFLSYARGMIDYRLASYFFLYCLGMLGVTLAAGGLVLDMPPRFVFDYVSDLIAKDVSYSQGVSKFFGYAALAAAFLFVKADRRRYRWLLAAAVLVCLALSLIGGARGDSFFAVATVLLYLTYVYGLRIIWPLIVLAAILSFAISNAAFLNDLVLVQRMQGAASGYGYRDVLLMQVGHLLVDRVDCLLVGCGYGFFQYYHNYPMGLYPHNIVAELVVIAGLPLTALFLYLSARGAFMEVRLNGISFIMLVFIYTFLLGLKSGAVSSSWLLMVLLVIFAARYVAYRMGYEQAFQS